MPFFLTQLCVLLIEQVIIPVLSDGLSALTQRQPSSNVQDAESQIPQYVYKKHKAWTCGEHIGGRVLITQVPPRGDENTGRFLDVVGTVLFPSKGVLLVSPARGYLREKGERKESFIPPLD